MEEKNPQNEDEFFKQLNEAAGSLKKKKSGGFQSMGLSLPVLRGILCRGYKVPTPIQRKVIPVLLEGHDVVAMARTGSGKTAAFLVPMFERLKTHSTTGVRALILSPTRELAEQTHSFIKQLGYKTGLKSALIIGGRSMGKNFLSIHSNPDILVATLGRLIHVLMEMSMSLNSVEYLVLDEADRIFEMNQQAELHEIISKLPSESRQTMLFSATLPKMLVDFAGVGLNNPQLIRLDVESKLSEQLRSTYLYCRSPENRMATLLCLLDLIPKGQLTLVFAATRHHVEYIAQVLTALQMPCTAVYSSLDQEARETNVRMFKNHTVEVMIATDVAARGIDIPPLDNVINYNFPSNSKLYVHRVGRVARAGRAGTSYSILAYDEAAYLVDLHLFLGRQLVCATLGTSIDADGVLGIIPQETLDHKINRLRDLTRLHTELPSLEDVANKAYKNYLRSRPKPSKESMRRIREILRFAPPTIHPLFRDEEAEKKLKFQEELKKAMSKIHKNSNAKIMMAIGSKRKVAQEKQQWLKDYKSKCAEALSRNRNVENLKKKAIKRSLEETATLSLLPQSTEKDIKEVFSASLEPPAKKKKRQEPQPLLVPYQPKDLYTEEGLGLQRSFYEEANKNVVDLMGDDAESLKKNKAVKKWDYKRRRFVTETGEELKKKKIKTESGAWIDKSYKTDRYKRWLEKSKADDDSDGGDDDKDQQYGKMRPGLHKRFTSGNKKGRKVKNELKSSEQIAKGRRIKEQRMAHQKKRGQNQRGGGKHNKPGGQSGGRQPKQQQGGFRKRK